MKQKITIGIAGARGSFSEEAARHYMQKEEIIDCELVYLVTVEAVLYAVEKGDIDKGIFPIENSNGGVVIESIYAMAKHSFSIERLFEIDVHHNLFAMPGVGAKDITEITSHDQALKQCRMYLKRCWPKTPLREYEDTAKAAEDLSTGVLPKTTAVIAPFSCAKLYNLEILKESIQDLKFNYTTFLTVVS